jgi:hypothetical protein
MGVTETARHSSDIATASLIRIAILHQASIDLATAFS